MALDQPLITMTVTRFAEPDALVWQALESLANQQGVCGELLFLDQAPNPEMTRRCQTLQSGQLRIRHLEIPPHSLSYARNQAIARADSDLILFLDADALAAPGWARALAQVLADDGVGVAGTRIVPHWLQRPLWVAKSRLVLDQYSVFDLGTERRSLHRVVGASFGIHRARLAEDAWFDEGLGRRTGKLLSGEESDLCHRALLRGLSVIYEGAACARHQIGTDRIAYKWLLRRFFYSGINRGTRGGAVNPSHPLGAMDYLVLPLVLPSYALGYLYGLFNRNAGN